MSHNSSKQLYLQTKSWLDTFKKKSDSKGDDKKESRMDHYKKKGFNNRR
jgi:hypothetical protein